MSSNPPDHRQSVRFQSDVTTLDDLLPKDTLEETLGGSSSSKLNFSALDIDEKPSSRNEQAPPLEVASAQGSDVSGKSPLARARTFVQQTLGRQPTLGKDLSGEKQKARRSTSSLVKYSLQCRERDFFQFDDTDTASQAGSDDDDDGTSVKTRESAARDAKSDSGRVGTIDRDFDDDDSDDDDEHDTRAARIKAVKQALVRYVLPIFLGVVALGLGVLFETVGDSAAFEAKNGFSYFALSCLIAIACGTWTLSRLFVNGIVKFYIRRVFALNFKLNYSLRGANKSMTFALWSVIMLLMVYFVPLERLNYDSHVTATTQTKALDQLYKLFIFFFLCGVVFVFRLYYLKTMMFEFHQNTYVERLKAYFFLEYVLDRLASGPLLSAGSTGVELRKSGSEGNTSRLGTDLGRRHVARSAAVQMSMHSVKHLSDWREISRSIWSNLSRADGDGMVQEADFGRLMPAKHARRAFELFDIDGSEFVTREEVDRVCRRYVKERRNLRLSVDDHRTIINRLSKFFTGIALTICLVFFLIIFSDIAQTLIVPAMTSILGFTFIFGSYAANTFENAAFIFQQHPYDVGDRVFIDEENLVVQSVEFSRTTFDRWDGRRISYPNSLLRSKIIVNVRRSPPMASLFKFEVGSGVPNVKIQEFETKLREFLRANPKDYYPDTTVDVLELCANMRCIMQFSVKHRDNWQDGGQRWRRHNAAGNFSRQTLDDLGIRFYNPPQNVEVRQVGAFTQPFKDKDRDRDRDRLGPGPAM